MKLAKIGTTISKMSGRTGLLIKKNSPEILLVAGVVGVIGSTIMACRATLKVEELLDEHRGKLNKIDRVVDKVENGEIPPINYTEKDRKKDVFVTYVSTGTNFLKLYGPAVSLGLLSIGCLVGSHGVMKRRNVALMAAYKAVEEGFESYRKRVVEEYGEEKDYMFKHGLRAETVNEVEVDEHGKTRNVKKTKLNPDDPNNLSPYARFYDEGCLQWHKNPEYNLMFLRTNQNYFNEMLKARGHVFLNEVYDALGIERSQAGSVVGWVISKDGDNFIDFGIFDGNTPRARAFVNGYEPNILLDFNVDGVIYDKI